ncbi:MAG: DNA replication/repair protein RecF [Fimbriimonadaceae bacterium]
MISPLENRETYALSTLKLENFRSYLALEIDFADGFHVIHGPNAQGKTNLLEAVHFLSTTRLLRGTKDSDAISHGSHSAKLEGEVGRTSLSIELETGVRKRAKINGLGLPRAADLIGRLPCVCVSSLDMAIVSGDPAERRLFLDLELSQAFPAYLRHLTLYKRALEQRNALLKVANDSFVDPESFEVWEVQLGEHGEALREFRRTFTLDLQNIAAGVQADLGDGEHLALTYAPKDESDLVTAYAQSRHHDIMRKTTTIGPHRDDLQIAVAGTEARYFGSQGQQRSCVISLKMATLQLHATRLGKAPLLLLDDILSDLDAERRTRLSACVVQNAGQVILTCTEKHLISKDILDKASLFRVQCGTVIKE